MSTNIRPFNNHDLEDVYRIFNQVQNEPLLFEVFKDDDERMRSHHNLRRIVCEKNGKVIGFAHIFDNMISLPKGFLAVKILIDQSFQNQGFGSLLEQELIALIQTLQPIGLSTQIRDTDSRSHEWSKLRGFSIHAHLYESNLSLNAYNPDLHKQSIVRPTNEGIQFTTLSNVMDNDKWDQLYELAKITNNEVPGREGNERYVSREEFDYSFTNSKTTSPETILIATYEKKMVGMTVLDKISDNELYTTFTGVLKEHRGKGIAYALKHLSIEYALSTNVTTMRTNNHSMNLPMLKINQKLGYQSQPGLYIMRKILNT